MKLRILAAGFLLAAVAPAAGYAQVSAAEVAELRAQIAALSARLAELEASADSPAVAATPAPAPRPAADVEWTDRIKIGGDFRYRFETIDQEGSDSRERHRIRARPMLTARVNDTLRTGFGLVTGGGNPVSGNQSLGDGNSSKPISLDQAWIEWTGLANTRVIGGKFKNPLHRVGDHGLVWDDDWRPEGAAATYSNSGWFLTGLASWLEGDTRNDSEVAVGLQGGLETTLAADRGVTLLAGYYHTNLAGHAPLFDDEDAFGNSVNPDGSYRYDFHLVELGAELELEAGDWPLKLFADYVKNLDADSYDTGWAVGAALGKASAPGTWRVRYVYQDLEADAVLGLLTDSNFGGGGTDATGHFLSADYAIAKNWIFRLTYFMDEIDGDAVDRGDTGAAELDYDRLILDFRYKY